MADLFALSERVIREGISDQPINRVNHQLSELTDEIVMVEAFSHSILFRTDAGLVVFDTSGAPGGGPVVDAVRGWSRDPFNTLIYTHGHLDHVGGSGAFVRDAADRGAPAPKVIGHRNVTARFERYQLTEGYNLVINARQFQGMATRVFGSDRRFLPDDVAVPDVIYDDTLATSVGGLEIELHHARGETDDHTWSWIPAHRAICAGDFFIWNFPNAGNPQKAQRYPREWAAALREMIAKDAELFLPAHGLPIRGRDTIRMVLDEVATSLEKLVADTLAMMNAGARLSEIVHTVAVDTQTLAKPYLRPLYDEPEFVVNNLWRLYGGWYDGNPANLKPAPESALAREVAALAGGVERLAERGLELAAAGEMRLACHLVEMAVLAEPDNTRAHGARAEVFRARRNEESSLMARGIFQYAAAESEAKSNE